MKTGRALGEMTERAGAGTLMMLLQAHANACARVCVRVHVFPYRWPVRLHLECRDLDVGHGLDRTLDRGLLQAVVALVEAAALAPLAATLALVVIVTVVVVKPAHVSVLVEIGAAGAFVHLLQMVLVRVQRRAPEIVVFELVLRAANQKELIAFVLLRWAITRRMAEIHTCEQ